MGILLNGWYKVVPPSYKWVINPLTIDISPINHSDWSYINNQLSYLGGTTLYNMCSHCEKVVVSL